MTIDKRLGAVLAWLATVAVVATVAWLAIDRVGRGLTGAAAAPPARSLPAVPTSSPPQRPTPRLTPSPSPSPSPTSMQPSPTPDRTASATTTGGTVRVACRSGQVRIRSILPRDGYRTETRLSGSSGEVHFETEGEGEETRLILRCTADGPTISFGPGD